MKKPLPLIDYRMGWEMKEEKVNRIEGEYGEPMRRESQEEDK